MLAQSYLCIPMPVNQTHINVFIAYCRKDVKYLDKLRIALKVLIRQNENLVIWDDREVDAGTAWEEEIKTNLQKANITLLLVSSNSLASDYFHDKEMKKALERHERRETIVIPIILKDCPWELSNLADIQALPKDGKPIDLWEHESSAYANIVRELSKKINKVKARRNKKQVHRMFETNTVKNIRSKGLRISLFVILLFLFPFCFNNTSSSKKIIEKLFKNSPSNSKKIIENISKNQVVVIGGTFEMGCTDEQSECDTDEYPTRIVTVGNFKIGKYEVTQEEWRAVMGNNPSLFDGCDKCPVERVSWNDAQDFIKKLNEETGQQFRLPTEAEWEFAAREGKGGYIYSGHNDLNKVGWHIGNSDGKPHIVGMKAENKLGLYDMSGNVWEWCNLYHSEDLKANSEEACLSIILRGGAWNSNARGCRVADRYERSPNKKEPIIGLRLAQTP